MVLGDALRKSSSDNGVHERKMMRYLNYIQCWIQINAITLHSSNPWTPCSNLNTQRVFQHAAQFPWHSLHRHRSNVSQRNSQSNMENVATRKRERLGSQDYTPLIAIVRSLMSLCAFCSKLSFLQSSRLGHRWLSSSLCFEQKWPLQKPQSPTMGCALAVHLSVVSFLYSQAGFLEGMVIFWELVEM